MAYRRALGLDMAFCGAQNESYASIESGTAGARSFGYPGGVENRGAVIRISFGERDGD